MVKKKRRDDEDQISIISLVIVSIFFGIIVGACIGEIGTDIALNQETADDICQQLTGNSTAIASEKVAWFDGKLICTIPNFDSTQNIIVKTNNE